MQQSMVLNWFERKVLGHNSLDNMMPNMTERAGILPYHTNHSLRATTVTVLSSNNVETQQIKAVTGHKSDESIESYCERPTLHQFKSMSSALTSFIHGSENTPPASTWSNPTTSTATQSGNSAEKIFTMPTNSVSVSQNEENFLLSNGVNPQLSHSAIREFPRVLIHFQHQYEQVKGLNCSLLRDFKLLVLVAAFLSSRIASL